VIAPNPVDRHGEDLEHVGAFIDDDRCKLVRAGVLCEGRLSKQPDRVVIPRRSCVIRNRWRRAARTPASRVRGVDKRTSLNEKPKGSE
jgi:hypothetical protein